MVGQIEDSQLHALVGYVAILDNNIQPCVYSYRYATPTHHCDVTSYNLMSS